jgi:hypothetical protein
VFGAGDGIRTRDINLGKVALYQLSYSRLPTPVFSLPAAVLSNPGPEQFSILLFGGGTLGMTELKGRVFYSPEALIQNEKELLKTAALLTGFLC